MKHQEQLKKHKRTTEDGKTKKKLKKNSEKLRTTEKNVEKTVRTTKGHPTKHQGQIINKQRTTEKP